MIMCSVFKSSKMEGMYLYVPKTTSKNSMFEGVPELLLERFGAPRHAMDLLLRKEKPLVSADVEKVMSELESKGFYLQLPPKKEDYMLDLHKDKKTSDHG